MMIVAVALALAGALVPLAGDDYDRDWQSSGWISSGKVVVTVERVQGAAVSRGSGNESGLRSATGVPVGGAGLGRLDVVDVRGWDDVRRHVRRYSHVDEERAGKPVGGMRAGVWRPQDVGAYPPLDVHAPSAPPSPAPASPPVVDGSVAIGDVAALGVDAGGVALQPARGWAYVNKPVYFASGAREARRRARVAGVDVEIRAWPVSYRWDWGDGESFVTADPGGPWPGGKVAHAYARPGKALVATVRTTWRAAYTVGGIEYQIPGTLTRTASSPPFDIVEAETVLVP